MRAIKGNLGNLGMYLCYMLVTKVVQKQCRYSLYGSKREALLLNEPETNKNEIKKNCILHARKAN